MKSLFKKPEVKETKFNAFLQLSDHNLRAVRGGEDPPLEDENIQPPPPPPSGN